MLMSPKRFGVVVAMGLGRQSYHRCYHNWLASVRTARLANRPVSEQIYGNTKLRRRWFTTAADGAGKRAPAPAAAEAEASAPPPTTITFEQGVRTARNGLLYLAIGGAVAGTAMLIGRELMPTRLSPNALFNEVFDRVRVHPEVISRVGENMKGYGQDINRRREGRRNFISHDKYVDLDGHKRIRIKFNIEGSRGNAVVYAEVADNMEKGEYAYIILEQRMRGRNDAVALIDNRRQYTREELQEKVSNRLSKLGAVLYGHSECQWTQRQQIEFGDYVKNLKILLCDKPEHKSECENAQLPGYPVWLIKGQGFPGYHSIEQMKNIALHI